MTEEEAKTKWCPHAGPTFCGEGVIYSPTERPVVLDESKTNIASVGDRCIASSCAAWRWIKPIPRFKEGTMEVDPETLNLPPTHGYCGLAGKP